MLDLTQIVNFNWVDLTKVNRGKKLTLFDKLWHWGEWGRGGGNVLGCYNFFIMF